MKEIHFINLSNGFLAIPLFDLKEVSFLRIQSTACEQKRWSNILNDLDSNFLMSLALGYKCKVYDFSERKPCTRAVYQGLEWVIYVLNRRWFDKEIIPYVKNNNVQLYFRECYNKLTKIEKGKIDFYKKFLNTNKLNIETISGNVRDCIKKLQEKKLKESTYE